MSAHRTMVRRVLGGIAFGMLFAHWTPVGSRSVQGEDTVNSTPGAFGSMVIVVGASGTDEYARMFSAWAARWQEAAEAGQVSAVLIEPTAGSESQLARVEAALRHEAEAQELPLWIILIGHGTFDGRWAKFNLDGHDLTAQQLSDWLAPIERPIALINTASASAPFIDRLSGPDRILITATKSGVEANFARFGDYLSQAVGALASDLDKDGQVSLLEAFLQASRETQAYYDGQRQVATEHALLEDTGDARGVRADFFSGLRAEQRPVEGAAVDGRLAAQWHLIPSAAERRLSPEFRRRRQAIEEELAGVRNQREVMTDEEYFQRIEPLLIQLARLYEEAEAENQEAEKPDTDEAVR